MNVQRKCAKNIKTEIHLSVNNVICHVNSNAVTDTKSSLTTIQQLWDIQQKHSFDNLFFLPDFLQFLCLIISKVTF